MRIGKGLTGKQDTFEYSHLAEEARGTRFLHLYMSSSDNNTKVLSYLLSESCLFITVLMDPILSPHFSSSHPPSPRSSSIKTQMIVFSLDRSCDVRTLRCQLSLALKFVRSPRLYIPPWYSTSTPFLSYT